MFVTSKIAEFFNTGFDIMTCDALAGIDGFKVDLFDGSLVCIDGFLGNIETEIFLAFHHGDP